MQASYQECTHDADGQAILACSLHLLENDYCRQSSEDDNFQARLHGLDACSMQLAPILGAESQPMICTRSLPTLVSLQ